MTHVIVRRATIADLELVAPLFDSCRQFYGGTPTSPPRAGSLSSGWSTTNR